MSLRWNPWTELSRVERELSDFFDGRNAALSPLVKPQKLHPAVDVHEDAQKIVLVVDLPGIDQKDVEINVEDNVLTLKGERKPEKVEGEAFRRYERAYGVFTRTFTLPRTVAADKVTAEMKAGVLTLTLPKRAEAQPRQIKINVG